MSYGKVGELLADWGGGCIVPNDGVSDKNVVFKFQGIKCQYIYGEVRQDDIRSVKNQGFGGQTDWLTN